LKIQIEPIPLLKDNYAYIVHTPGSTVAIDPSEAAPVHAFLKARHWKLDYVLSTHHHWDHIGGNAELKSIYGCKVIGPRGDRSRIPEMDLDADEGKVLVLGGLTLEVLSVPGHTLHATAYWSRDAQAVFTGDTLFLMGCGRLFEGTPAQMWASLSKLAALPPETRIYCGHEYTAEGGRFALSLFPEENKILRRVQSLPSGRTVPGTLSEELETNPFLKVSDPGFRERYFGGKSAVAAFAELRERKDDFS
jgi:hydroxyacylglutathione hydrolase